MSLWKYIRDSINNFEIIIIYKNDWIWKMNLFNLVVNLY